MDATTDAAPAESISQVSTPAMQAAVPGAMPRYTHQQIIRVITGIMLCILLGALDQTVVIPAVPAIAADLNAFGHLSWIVTAYLLTSTAATPIYGRLSDIYGRRKLLLFALALFILASILCALAGSLPQLIGARALQGLGGAGLLAMAQAAVADVVSPRERGRYQGYMASMWGVASIAGPVVGGYVTDHLSWRWVFWINLPLGLVAMWLCDRALRMLPLRQGSAKIDYVGAALLVGGVTALLLMLSWGGVEYPWISAPVVGAGLLGAVLLAALVWQEKTVGEPLLPPRLFANSVFTRGVLVAFFASLGLFGATFTLPLVYQLLLGREAGESGLLVMPFLGSSVLGAFGGGQLARRLGRTKAIVVGGLGGCVLGFLMLTTVGPATPAWPIMIYSAVLGFSIGATMPSVLMMVQNAAERRDVGVATGTMLFLRSMGSAFGSTIVGALLAARFATGLAEAGINARVDLGDLRGGSNALAGLDAAARVAARDALSSGFRLGYLVCAVLLVLAVVIAAGLRDLPLRSDTGPKEIGH